MLAVVATVLAMAVGLYMLRQYIRGGQCTSSARMDGKTVVITGCNTGIGKETVLDMVRRGARVAMACRNTEKTNAAADDVRREVPGADVAVYKCDLSSLKSVRECAEEINAKEDRIDVLINNAGVMMCPYTKTEDGFEMQIGTNHFGHFLFTNLLLDKIKASAPSRVVTVSSLAHESGAIDLDDLHWERREYSRLAAYNQSKLANVLFSRELSRRLSGSGVTTYCLHPGVIATDLGRHIEDMMGLLKYMKIYIFDVFLTKTAADGAQTTIDCAVNEALAKQSGKYYADCREKEPKPQGQDDETAKKLWDITAKAVGL